MIQFVAGSSSMTEKLSVSLCIHGSPIFMHERFGKGEVLNLEGVEQIKAEIKFEVGGIKTIVTLCETGYYWIVPVVLVQ
jgi:DNA helicase-2/ATP-dependent DNA helicase PcrA